jgi:hypothetical protein
MKVRTEITVNGIKTSTLCTKDFINKLYAVGAKLAVYLPDGRCFYSDDESWLKFQDIKLRRDLL